MPGWKCWPTSLTAPNNIPARLLQLTLYWHTLRFLTDNYQVRVSLLDLTTGQYRLPTDLRQPGDYPTARWLPRSYVSDPYIHCHPRRFPRWAVQPGARSMRLLAQLRRRKTG